MHKRYEHNATIIFLSFLEFHSLPSVPSFSVQDANECINE